MGRGRVLCHQGLSLARGELSVDVQGMNERMPEQTDE